MMMSNATRLDMLNNYISQNFKKALIIYYNLLGINKLIYLRAEFIMSINLSILKINIKIIN
jgi:hypothetical protein